MIFRRRVAPTLLAALFALALPAVASAAEYQVNTTADGADKAPGVPCEINAGAGVCSLRAAIEVANGTTGVPDEIKFATNPFNGENGDTISAAGAFQAITDQLTIHGGICDTSAGVEGPCAGVIRVGGGSLFVVEDDAVEIQGLAINGAMTAINVINESQNFAARGNWIGFDLTGATSGNSTGIFIDPGSDGATIGGPEATERNVIGGNAGVGLDLLGASDATIRGNYFGVTPEGDAVAANATDIEVTDSTASGGIFKAEDNEIGAVFGGVLFGRKCDSGCNVISGASGAGIELHGGGDPQEEAPATGPTFVRGNFIGLNAAGTAAIDAPTYEGNGTYGVSAGGADRVRVGGAFGPETNFIAGGQEAIFSSGGEDFEASGNVIGFGTAGGDAAPPAVSSIFVLGDGVTEPATIDGNSIRMTGGVGIEDRFVGATITDNAIKGSEIGILTKVSTAPFGNVIGRNSLWDMGGSGILIENEGNEVFGNFIVEAGDAGIRIKNPPGVANVGNLVGGSTPNTENQIENSGGPAIEIVEEALEPGSRSEIAQNNGRFNKGLFIDLVGGANEGIEPPSIATASQSAAGGSAEPGAVVRVFSKASAEPGEISSSLAKTVADAAGNWKVVYGPVPAGAIVAATQTSTIGSTSELATKVAVADAGIGGGGSGSGSNPDTKAPKATITKGPKAKSTKTTAKFKFKSNEAGSTFQCKLDMGKFKNCRPPKTYKKLKPGKHVFKVRATDKAGNVGKPAKKKFTVLS